MASWVPYCLGHHALCSQYQHIVTCNVFSFLILVIRRNPLSSFGTVCDGVPCGRLLSFLGFSFTFFFFFIKQTTEYDSIGGH